jgi:hypothetical protein
VAEKKATVQSVDTGLLGPRTKWADSAVFDVDSKNLFALTHITLKKYWGFPR